jgi:hypothetical protein
VNVADLQQHLTDLGRLLSASKASQVAKELSAIAEGLRPFREMTLPAFAKFLGQAHEYAAGGILPTGQNKGSRSGGAKQTKVGQPGGTRQPKAAVDPQQVAERIRQVYDTAGDLSRPAEEVEEALRQLHELKRPGLIQAAEAIGLKVLKSDKVDAIRESIRQRVLERRGSAQRVNMTTPLPPPTQPVSGPRW